MILSVRFLVNSILLGVGLAMDAFSVSLANGLNDNNMKMGRMCAIAGTFTSFQFLMPLAGWICVHTVATHFKAFEARIPWIALLLLAYIGGKMLCEGMHNEECENGAASLGVTELIIQGVATSIDALSVGFTIASYNAVMSFFCSLIIAIVTFFICFAGLVIGKHFGTKLSGKASILGGCILILIGLKIFISNII